MAESKEELKSVLIRVEEESENAGLKLSMQKTKIMVSSPISSVQSISCIWLFVTPWTAACQASLSITNFWSLLKLMSIELVMGKKWKQWQILFSWAPKSKIKRHLLLGRKASKLSVIKRRRVTVPTQAHKSQSYDFSNSHVQMWVGP